jgi:AraC family transcriptional regulator of adaptative response / DNA-3-methyladenine glycosylase II
VLRARHRNAPGAPGAGAVALRLAHRRPFDAGATLGFLGLRALPGVESYDGTTYRRSLRLPYGEGVAALSPGEGCVHATLHLADLRDLTAAVNRCRRLLDLDADPEAVDEVLGRDRALAPSVRRHPGRRVAGTVDGPELAVRAVIGQQVSVGGARTVAGRLVAALGEPLRAPRDGLTHLFPAPAALAGADPACFAMPAARRVAVQSLAAALERGELALDPGAEPEAAAARLLALPGIGPWTAGYVALRALGDPDAFLPGDLGVRRAVRGLGLADDPASVARRAERWRPWRGYAMAHLWALPPAARAPSARDAREKESAA